MQSVSTVIKRKKKHKRKPNVFLFNFLPKFNTFSTKLLVNLHKDLKKKTKKRILFNYKRKMKFERLKKKRKTKCISCILIQYIIFYLNKKKTYLPRQSHEWKNTFSTN